MNWEIRSSFEWRKPVSKLTRANRSELENSLDIVLEQQTLRRDYKSNALRTNATIDWPLGNRSSNVAPLTIDFQVIVTISRVLGCHPHSLLSSEKRQKTRKLAKLYSIIWIIAITVAILFEIKSLVLCRMEDSGGDNLCILSIPKRMAVLSAHLISATFSVTRGANFEIAITRIQDFDEATCSRNKYDVLTNFVAAGLLILTWCYVFWIFRLFNKDFNPLLVFYVLGLCVLTLELYKFCFVFVALLRRFQQLKTLVSSGKIDVGATKGVYYQALTVQNVFKLHYWLIDAAENFNKYFDVLIVYWLVYFISDLMIHVFMLAHGPVGSNVESSQIARLAFSLYHSALICIVSHFTSKRANELGKLLFGYRAPSLNSTVSSLEILEFGFYLYKQPLRITGLKLFSVDLPLLLSIIEASATYTTLIIQNASELYQKLSINNETEVK